MTWRNTMPMTKAQAEYLAKAMDDRKGGYAARRVNGHWLVWCWAADHEVEFDDNMLEAAAKATSRTRCPLCAAGERHLSCG